jgi:hypothetical protein
MHPTCADPRVACKIDFQVVPAKLPVDLFFSSFASHKAVKSPVPGQHHKNCAVKRWHGSMGSDYGRH